MDVEKILEQFVVSSGYKEYRYVSEVLTCVVVKKSIFNGLDISVVFPCGLFHRKSVQTDAEDDKTYPRVSLTRAVKT